MRVLIADKMPERCVQELSSLGFDVVNEPGLSGDTLTEAIGDVHVLVVRSTKVPAHTLTAGRRLQLVVRAGAGVNTIDIEAAAGLGVFVANCPGKNAVAVAELTMGLILALDRRIADNVASLRAGRWEKSRFGRARGLYGRTLGIVGLGRIGEELVTRAQAFGLRCIAWSRSLSVERAEELGIGFAPSVLALCEQSDIVSVHVAKTPETTHLIGAKELAAMPEGSFFLNMARGGVVDDSALAEAIGRGHIRAASDVYEEEPKGGAGEYTSGLADLADFYGTHHIGASTEQAQEAVATEVLRIIRAWSQEGVVHNCVNVSTQSQASGQLLVRHRDRVGVLATVLDVLKSAHINVQEMENLLFAGGEAACAKIVVAQVPSDRVLSGLRSCSEDVLGVEWLATPENSDADGVVRKK